MYQFAVELLYHNPDCDARQNDESIDKATVSHCECEFNFVCCAAVIFSHVLAMRVTITCILITDDEKRRQQQHQRQLKYKLVHRSGRKIMTLYVYCFFTCGSDRFGFEADGRRQITITVVAGCWIFSSCHSDAFEQKRSCFVVFVPQQEINQTLDVQRSIFAFHIVCVPVRRTRERVCSSKTAAAPFFCCSLIISLCEIKSCIRTWACVCVCVCESFHLLEKGERVAHFSRCFRS